MVDVVSMPRKKLSSKRVCSSNISFHGCVYHILSLKERFVFVSEHYYSLDRIESLYMWNNCHLVYNSTLEPNIVVCQNYQNMCL